MVIAIIIAFVIVLIIGSIMLKTYNFKDLQADPFMSGKINLSLKSNCMSQKEVEFYFYVNKRLGDHMVILPRVSMDSILIPEGDKRQYKALLGKLLDFVIFEKRSMKPLLVIDLVEHDFVSGVMQYYDKNVTKVLNALNLPVIDITVKDFYIFDEIKQKIDDALQVKTAQTNGGNKPNKD